MCACVYVYVRVIVLTIESMIVVVCACMCVHALVHEYFAIFRASFARKFQVVISLDLAIIFENVQQLHHLAVYQHSVPPSLLT